MASYVAMEPPGTSAVADDAVFVRDGFAYFAFLVPFLWFLWYRMWIEALAVLALAVVLAAVGTLENFAGAVFLVTLAIYLLIGLEAANLRLAALRRRGWREWGVIVAPNKKDAEARYYAEVMDSAAPVVDDGPPPASTPPSTAPSRRTAPGPALGLLDYPGGAR